MVAWVVAGFVCWLWGWKAAVYVAGAGFAVQCAMVTARIGHTRILTRRLTEAHRIKGLQIEALFRRSANANRAVPLGGNKAGNAS
jgi:hypothetical protein